MIETNILVVMIYINKKKPLGWKTNDTNVLEGQINL